MARTGNFGRQPRSSPSITNTIIAIAREQQAREDDNIMDAWQKGGLVDGQKVTDEMVLKHWQARLVDISEDDPLHDTYKNSVLQLEYSIAQSKMTANYALIADPKSGDDMKMANFFLNWAKKVPKNSEFYRVLQRDAGQYLRAAKSRRTVKARVNTEKIYRDRMLNLERKNEATGQAALRVVTLLAQEGAVIGENPLGDKRDIANRSNLSQVNIGGVDALMALLGTVMNETDVVNAATGFVTGERNTGANSKVLYTDENGQSVTGKSLVAQFKALDPSFNGKFDLAYVQGAISSARDGIDQRIALARKTGHIAEASALSLEQAKLNEFSRQVDAYPVASEYNDLHSQMNAVYKNDFLLPDAKVAEITRIRGEMGKLAKDPRIADDTRMQTQLQGEAEGRVGVPTLGEDLSGESTGYGQDTKDNEFINAELELYVEQKRAVDSMEMVYTQGAYVDDPITGARKFVAQTNGPSVGAALMSDINNLPGVGAPVAVAVPNGDGGGMTPMYVMPAPIMVKASNPLGGEMTATDGHPAGSFISYVVNGQMKTLYSITRDGTTSWTDDPPWDPSKVKVDPTRTNGVMTVTMQNTPDESTVVLTTNGAIPGKPGYEVRGAVQDEKTGQWSPGQVMFNPKEALAMTDPERLHAGPDPFTDSFSASLAAIKGSPDGVKLLNSWSSDQRFKEVLDHNAHMAAGQTFNPASGTWDGGDPAGYNRNISTMNKDLSAAKGGMGYLNPDSRDNDWRKDTTVLAPDAVRPILARAQYNPNDPFAAPSQFERDRLPSTFIQANPTAKMQALAFSYLPGTNQLKTGGKAENPMAITAPATIKLPSYGGFNPTPNAPKATPAPPPDAVASPTPYSPPAYSPPTPPASSYKPPSMPGDSGSYDHGR